MRTSRQNGVGLLEVLITVLVLSVGLLGLAGLQLAGLRNNNSAYMRSQATVLAQDIADRARANSAGNYNNIAGAQNAGCTSTAGCTAAQMAQNDVFQWNQMIAATLPGGQGKVCVDSTPNDGTPAAPACDDAGNLLAVKVWWEDARNGSNVGCDGQPATKQCFYTSFRP